MRKSRLFPIVALLFVAAVFGLRPRSIADYDLHHKGFETIRLAEHLAQDGAFSSPFDTLDTGPSAHLAPGYPFIIAGIFRHFGDDAFGDAIVCWTTALVVALQLALLPYLAWRFGMPTIAGLLAALIFLRGDFAIPAWEVNYVGLMVVLLALCTFSGSAISNWTLVNMGVLWGLTLLFSPVVILVLPVWLLWLRRYRQATTRSILFLALIPALMVTPWIVRDYSVFHRLVFIRDNLGLEMAAANNPCAGFDAVGNMRNGCYALNHPNQSLQQAMLVRSLGESEYNRRRLADFLQWLRGNPGKYLGLSLERFAAFWFPWNHADSLKTLSFGQVMTWIMTILGFLGLWRLWKSNRAVCTYLLMWLAIFPLSYYLIVAADDHRRIPILWATFIPASYYFFEIVGGDWYSFLEPRAIHADGVFTRGIDHD